MSFQICIDIGGTFTDLYLWDNKSNESHSIKVPTTPNDLTSGFMNAIEEAGEIYDLSAREILENTERLIHGTTISTNAMLEDDVDRTGLITTEGFRDTLVLREGGKYNPYDWDMDYPDPYIPRELTIGVKERINAEGGIETTIDTDDVRKAIEQLQSKDVDAIAVSLLWSHINPEHEKKVGELIEEVAPNLHYSLSHEVNPIIREYRRTISTCIDASLYGLIQEYFTDLKDTLVQHGYKDEPLIITANGGIMTSEELARHPVWTVDSGPTMFPVSSREYVNSELGEDNVIALDMGGTSFDMAVVQEGNIPRTREAKIGDDLLGIEKVEVESIGSGGGSVAWVDKGGLLHVGPKSAGSQPGPVCYGRGGDEPTVTDAALVLGYLSEDYFLGGKMNPETEAAREAIEMEIATPLGLTVEEAAHLIYATSAQDLINGIQEVTVERGIDPRQYILSGGGGALGMFATPVADELQIEELLLPREAGVISATGGLRSDIRRDFSASLLTDSEDFDFDGVNEILSSLEADASAFFDRVSVPEENRKLNYYTEARYPQQIWELETAVPTSRIDDEEIGTLTDNFHKVHDNTYGFSQPEQSVEFLYWRIEAVGKMDGVGHLTQSEATAPVSEAVHDERKAYFDGEYVDSKAYDGSQLEPSHKIDGPAFIDADTTTIVLPPGSHLEITEMNNYYINP